MKLSHGTTETRFALSNSHMQPCTAVHDIKLVPTVVTRFFKFSWPQLLDAFEKLRKATISFMSVCLTVCLSFRMQQLGFHWTHFDKI